MKLSIFKPLALLAVVVAAEDSVSHKCASGAHIIVARGSAEPQGAGLIGQVAHLISRRIEGSDVESVVYPALFEPYLSSQTLGVGMMTKAVQDYVEKCPSARIILLGYSQGAHVTADVLCGASSNGFPPTPPQVPEISNKVAAVILMGDPSYTSGQLYNRGTGQGDGIFPRLHPEGCDEIADRTISFCDKDDPFCQVGGDSFIAHMNYVTAYGLQATDFAVSMFYAH